MAGDWPFPPYTKTVHLSSYPAIDPTNPANSAAGKVVVVTGDGAGIGKHIAKAFVKAGAEAIIILGRRENLLDEAKKELQAEGASKVLSFKADVVDEAALGSAFESTAKECGLIDIVVANAGYSSTPAPAATSDVKDYWKVFEVNILGTFLTFRAWLPHRATTGTPTFISLNTAAAHAGIIPGASSYGASKPSALHLVTYLQAENPDIRAVSYHPGVLETDMLTKSKLTLEPDDMSLPAGFAVWLASPAADFVGGRCLWAAWDVDELVRLKEDIVSKNELTVALNGWPKDVGEVNVVA